MSERPRTPKVLEYPNFWEGTSSVVYVVFPDQCCVFSGITKGGTSTINAAGRIIELIAQREEIDPCAYRWYDLQTHRQYGYEYGCPHPGEFEFDELQIVPNPVRDEEARQEHEDALILIAPEGAYRVVSWSAVCCPENIIQAFREYIGDMTLPAHQLMKSDDHDPQRPQGLRVQEVDMDPELLPIFNEVESLGRRRMEHPRNAGIRRKLGDAWSKLRDLLIAGKRIHPQSIVCLEIAMSHDVDAREFLARHMLSMLPGNIETLRVLGGLFEETGRLPLAEELYREALDNLQAGLRKRGCNITTILADTTDGSQQAVAEYRSSVLDLGDLYTRLSNVQMQRGICALGIVTAQCAQRLHAAAGVPKSEPWRIAGECAARLGDPADAITALERALQIQEEHGGFGEPDRIRAILCALREDHPNITEFLDGLDVHS